MIGRPKRIGKEYRVTRADLEAFAGGNERAQAPVSRNRQVIASNIVDIDAIGPEDSHRITTMVMASLNARKGRTGFPPGGQYLLSGKCAAEDHDHREPGPDLRPAADDQRAAVIRR